MPRSRTFPWLLWIAVVCASGCARADVEAGPGDDGPRGEPGSGAPDEALEQASPPFAVRGELDGLLLVWFDGQGAHTASRRSEVPEARRGAVRVDSLAVPPERRLDPEHVYVADVRSALPDGTYPVFLHSRRWFDGQVEAARGAVPAVEAAPVGSGAVTLYSASWCGACRSAASYLRSRSVAFAEKDIEQDAQANAEMLQKARSAGKTPRGVPVIDFRGHIVLGFDRHELDALIDKYKAL